MKPESRTTSVEAVDRPDDRGRHPPKVQPTYVWVSLQRRIQAKVVNESAGGIGVIIAATEVFEIGFQVRVEMESGRRTARIVYLEKLSDGDCRMGLAWE